MLPPDVDKKGCRLSPVPVSRAEWQTRYARCHSAQQTGVKQPIRGDNYPDTGGEEGYEVFVVTDASGTFNKTTRDAAWARMTQAGCQLMTWFAVACELHRDWRNDVEGLGTLFSNHLPSYRCLITSYLAGRNAEQKR